MDCLATTFQNGSQVELLFGVAMYWKIVLMLLMQQTHGASMFASASNRTSTIRSSFGLAPHVAETSGIAKKSHHVASAMTCLGR